MTLVNFSSINLVFIFRCSCYPSNSVYVSRVDSSDLVLVFHLTDTDLWVLSWTLSLSIHINKDKM